ncbi:MAG: VOC family protein [Solirubrobacteraceae bacterium]
MEPQVQVITLAVEDLQRALEFYRDGLGLQTRGIVGTDFEGDETNPAGAVVMFELEGGLTLALYPRTELAKDACVPFAEPKTGEFSIGQIVATREEVDAVLAQAKAAGALVTDEPHERAWGIYSGYFRDLDGHLWEIIWSPSR